MSKKVWGIELGTHSVKAVKMLVGKEGLEINDLDVVEVPPEDPDLEQSREERLQTALETLRDNKDIKKTEPIYISIPGHQTLNKLISVTLLDPSKFRETVKFEAQQQMPISLDDTIWDYQLVDRKPEAGQEVQVSLFVVRKEIVNTYLQLMEAAQLTVTGIQVAPLAIYNFIKYDQKFPKSGIVVDIGADNTDVVVIDENKIWIRTVPNGGANITKALKQRFKIPAEEAEKLKVKAAKSKQAQKIFGVMKPALRELLSEINRSIGFYKSQHPKVKLNYMLLMGAGSHLLGLKKFFEQQLQHRVDKLTHLKKLKLGREANPATLQDNIATLGVALGLAIQAADAAENRVNLVPPEIKVGSLVQQKFKFVAAAAMVMVLAAILPLFNLGNPEEAQRASASLRSVSAAATSQQNQHDAVRPLDPILAEMTRYSSDFDGYEVAMLLEDALRDVANDTAAIENELSTRNSVARIDASDFSSRATLTRRQWRQALGNSVQALDLYFNRFAEEDEDEIRLSDLGRIAPPVARRQPIFLSIGPVSDQLDRAFIEEIETYGVEPGREALQFDTTRVTFPRDDGAFTAFYQERVGALQLDLALPIDNWDDAPDMLQQIDDLLEEQLEAKVGERIAGRENLTFAAIANTRADQVDPFRGSTLEQLTGADFGGFDDELTLNRYWQVQLVGIIRATEPGIGREVARVGEEVVAHFPQGFRSRLEAFTADQLRSQPFLLSDEEGEVTSGTELRLAVDEVEPEPPFDGQGRLRFVPADPRAELEITEESRIFAPTP